MGTDAVRDTIAGAAGGITKVLVGQPFDLVKVRLQTRGGNALLMARNIWKLEGPRAFYKGTVPPMLGVGACVSIQFGSFHLFQQMLQAFNRQSKSRSNESLGQIQLYLAGGAAGMVNSVISGPVEHIRIRLQTQPHSEKRLYSSPLDCIIKIWKQSGISGIYRGQGVTLLREFQGYGVWFTVYESLVGEMMKREGCLRSEIPGWKFAVCGGIAGEFLWLLSYPLDVIKSKMQSDGFGPKQEYANMRETVQATYRAQGVIGFFRGIGPALLRAMPVSAGIFATVEAVRKALG